MPNLLPADKRRDTIVRAEDTTNPEYGFSSPKDIPVEHLIQNGVICLDKPSGPTSHEVTTWVRRILDVDKTGHSGTLDPAVTGILPVGTGDATRAMQALLPAGKEYICVLELHQKTPEEDIRRVVAEFTGKLYQKPPLRSSVKRVLRVREVYYTEILEIRGRLALFRVGCQAGTYIRKLCFDIGEALGSGGHMRELRRTRVGKFLEDEHLCTLHDLTDAYHFWKEDGNEAEIRKFILPVESAVAHLPEIVIRDSAVDALCHGADLAASGVLRLSTGIQPDDMIAIRTLKGELVCLSNAQMNSDTIAKAKSGIVAITDRVLMERGRYPRLWKSGE
jgi:H/ACA ribonucleoprotein complex subunit 4